MSEHERDRPGRPAPTRADAAQAAQRRAAGSLDPTRARLLALQRAAGNDATAELIESAGSPVHAAIAGGGHPLAADVRSDMERRLGHDFGDVRVHTGAAADDSAAAVQARAYTVGNHVVFGRDGYDPHSRQGRHTLAHELTHVVQQRQGPVDGRPVGDGVSVSDPDDPYEREAAATADAVTADDVEREA